MYPSKPDKSSTAPSLAEETAYTEDGSNSILDGDSSGYEDDMFGHNADSDLYRKHELTATNSKGQTGVRPVDQYRHKHRLRGEIYYRGIAIGHTYLCYFEIYLKIGSYRLPTHRRDAHKKIVSMIFSFFKSKF